MPVETIIKGRVLYVSTGRVVLARGARLFESLDGGRTWSKFAVVPVGMRDRGLMESRFTRRLLRRGVHYLCGDEKRALIVANKSTYQMDNGNIHLVSGLRGSRPLGLCQHRECFYYGEYRSNPERSAVNIWKWCRDSTAWESVWSFTDVRHVHGVFHDPYSDAFWVTTGDNNSESAIWCTNDNFSSLNKIVGGSQQFRAVRLLFTIDHVYFGSDAPNEKNYVYRMDRSGGDVEQLCSVDGPVFFGCKVGGSLFFSTAVEPSLVNTCRDTQVWGSFAGEEWQLVKSFRKDVLSMKYFQYGQVQFPSGEGDNEHLWVTPMSTKFDQRTFRLPLCEIFS